MESRERPRGAPPLRPSAERLHRAALVLPSPFALEAQKPAVGSRECPPANVKADLALRLPEFLTCAHTAGSVTGTQREGEWCSDLCGELGAELRESEHPDNG